MQIAGKRVLLTGAAGGLGEVSARALAEHGATMILSGRDEQRLNELAASLPGDGHEVIVADLSVADAAERVVGQAGRVDILIANAGRPGGDNLAFTTSETVTDVLRINLESPIQMSRAVLEQMKERGEGQIVLVASMAGKFAMPGSTLYSSTKSGLRAFGWALRAEVAKYGVGVTLISPGFVSEVGMFAKRNGKAPPGSGMVSPSRYARELVEAIEKDRGEAVIASPQLRGLGQFSLIAPGLVERIFRRVAPARGRRD
ncbi:MAG: SDR family NAD(P)-dependent oxidoreductase [Actinobacteria bacterium]|nr:SDR family NAD(P)-dependent oxidoreductase [Actinomycetota bacterium]